MNLMNQTLQKFYATLTDNDSENQGKAQRYHLREGVVKIL